MQTNTLPDTPAVSMSDLAVRLGVHRATLSEWVRRRLVRPGFRVGSNRRWTAQDAETIVRQANAARWVAYTLKDKIEPRGHHRWGCPACGRALFGSRPLCALTHLKTCSAVWRQAQAAIKRARASDKPAQPAKPVKQAQPVKPVPASRCAPVLVDTREALRAMAERAIDGDLALAKLTIAVQRRLDRIAEIEGALRRLRGERS